MHLNFLWPPWAIPYLCGSHYSAPRNICSGTGGRCYPSSLHGDSFQRSSQAPFQSCHSLPSPNCLKYSVFLLQVGGACIFKFLTPVKAWAGPVTKSIPRNGKHLPKFQANFWPNLAVGVRLCSPSINSTLIRKGLLHLDPAWAVIADKFWPREGVGDWFGVAHFPLSPLTRPAHDNEGRELPEGRRLGSPRIKRSQGTAPSKGRSREELKEPQPADWRPWRIFPIPSHGATCCTTTQSALWQRLEFAI